MAAAIATSQFRLHEYHQASDKGAPAALSHGSELEAPWTEVTSSSVELYAELSVKGHAQAGQPRQPPPLSAAGAYFSVTPPISPIRLVLVDSQASGHTAGPVRMRTQRILHGMQEIMDNNIDMGDSDQPGDDCAVSAASSTPPPLRRKNSNKAKRFVRALLGNVLSELPVPCVAKKSSHEQQKMRGNHGSRQRSPQPMSAPGSRETVECRRAALGARSCCSIAVQALAGEPPRSPVRGRSPGGARAEWAGGVRALRDSHVRLVLRQLRHIHRLNRALDRAAGVGAASYTR